MTEVHSGVNLTIFGSCVSRDAYSDSEPGIAYIARSSLVSAFSKPFSIPDSIINSADLSPWSRRMVKTDCLSQATEIISSHRAPVALIDLVDERFNVYVRGDSAVTASLQFTTVKGDMLAKSRGYQVLSIFDSEHFERWKSGADELIRLLRMNSQRILINNIKFGSKDTDGNEVQPDFCKKFNIAIEPYYSHLIDTHGCEQIHDPNYSFIVDAAHRWGTAPFHYTSDVYTHIRSKVVGVPGTSEA